MDEFLSGKAVEECTPSNQRILLEYFAILVRQWLAKVHPDIRAYFQGQLLTRDSDEAGKDRSRSRLAALCDRMFYGFVETNPTNRAATYLKTKLRGQCKSYIETGIVWRLEAMLEAEAKSEIAHVAPPADEQDKRRARDRLYIPALENLAPERLSNDEVFADFADATATRIGDKVIADLLDSREFPLTYQKRYWIQAYCQKGGKGDPSIISLEAAMEYCNLGKSQFYTQMEKILQFLGVWISENYPTATVDNKKRFFLTLFHIIELRLREAKDIPNV